MVDGEWNLTFRFAIDGESSETYFLYDGGTVIMESDENGDVVTLRSDGEIAATYYYDAFGNVLSKTGEADNSILYAGYQYDEETGLYYVNARMYDSVTARFLQADTYLGNLNDPLSLNLYTYCLNNPDRYVDPSGHSAVLTILGFVAARVIIGLAAGIVSSGMEVFNQKVLEKRTRVNYDLVLFEGISNGIIAMTTSAVAAIGKNAAKQTAKVTARKIGRKLLQGVALGAAEGMAMDVGRQIIEGTKIKDVSFTQALGSGVTGGIFGAVGVGMEFGLDALKKTRGFVKLQSKAKTTISKGANAIKVKFAELADGNNRGTLNWNAFKKDTVTEALEETVEGGNGTITRSAHAEVRSIQGRNVGNAINDVNKVTPSKIYMQDDGRYVVQGNNGRVHILEPDGEIVTTMNKVTNFNDRVRKGRYIPLTESQKTDFAKKFGQYLNSSWDSYR